MSNTDQIKSRLALADVISSYVKLEKAGANFKACCPFHNEKTPSFYVSPSRGVWHCFGCDTGGDIFSFVMQIEKVDFPEALKTLASRAGVELAREDPRMASEKTRLLKIIIEAKNFYKAELLKRQDVLKYLKERGLTDETIKEFELGFAPDGWRNIFDFLTQKGFVALDIEKTGLIIKKSSVQHSAFNVQYYDRFRNRIMFPINDASGRTIAFGGRIFDSAESAEIKLPQTTKPAKYINSPQTALYDKSRALYGYDKAKIEMAKQDFCVLVEGYMDLIMSYQAGAKNTVAVSGTALTKEHLNLISRLTKKIITSFDTDAAGVSATGRSIDLILSLGLEANIVNLKGEKDPADFIKNNSSDGGVAWLEELKKAVNIIEFYIQFLKNKHSENKINFLKDAVKIIFPYLNALASEMEKSFWIKKIADLGGGREESLWQDFNKFRKTILSSSRKETLTDFSPAKQNNLAKRKDFLEKRIIGIASLLHSKNFLKGELAHILEAHENFFSSERIRALGHLLKKEAGLSEQEIFELEALALEAEFIYNCEVAEFEVELKILLKDLKREAVKEKMDALGLEIKNIENDKNNEGEEEILLQKIAEFNKLSKELNELR